MPAIPRLRTFVFHIEIATFKLSKPCLTCSTRWSVFTIMILPPNDDFTQPFFCFSRTNVDMITERYNTDAIVWRTQLLCDCRLMSSERTDVISNSYATYSLVRHLLEKPEKTYAYTWCIRLLLLITSRCYEEKHGVIEATYN